MSFSKSPCNASIIPAHMGYWFRESSETGINEVAIHEYGSRIHECPRYSCIRAICVDDSTPAIHFPNVLSLKIVSSGGGTKKLYA